MEDDVCMSDMSQVRLHHFILRIQVIFSGGMMFGQSNKSPGRMLLITKQLDIMVNMILSLEDGRLHDYNCTQAH